MVNNDKIYNTFSISECNVSSCIKLLHGYSDPSSTLDLFDESIIYVIFLFLQDIIGHSELYHLYMKHILTLESADIKLVHDICASYDTVLLMLDSSSMTEIVNQVGKIDQNSLHDETMYNT